MKTAPGARNMEENMKLQEIVANRCGKEISQCTNEELYYALLEMTKGNGTITVDFTQHTVSAGDIALILPGQLHSIGQFESESMEYENIIFHPNMLISKKTDTCNTDYLVPLLSGNVSLPLLYTPDG